MKSLRMPRFNKAEWSFGWRRISDAFAKTRSTRTGEEKAITLSGLCLASKIVFTAPSVESPPEALFMRRLTRLALRHGESEDGGRHGYVWREPYSRPRAAREAEISRSVFAHLLSLMTVEEALSLLEYDPQPIIGRRQVCP